MELRRIIVGVDGSPAADAALRWATAAVVDGGEIVAVYATGTALIGQAAASAATGLGVFRDMKGRKEEAGRALEMWCAPLRASGVPYRAVVSDDEPVEALLGNARREEADLIVIGHHGATGFLNRLFQGLGDNLIEHARRPVVVVPSPPSEGASW
jgi:nucleotide-binding universal stress UspA family protein